MMAAPRGTLGPGAVLREHWPEYVIEAWALGVFMICAGVFSTLLGYPESPLLKIVPSEHLRRAVIGVAMGLTAIALIYSPWGKRSGAHMNPAVTLTFLRLGRIARWDAVFYIAAQFIGGCLGVLLTAAVLRDAFTVAPVHYVATLPGPAGPAGAFVAEFVISALLMAVILRVSNTPKLAPFTGVCAGAMVAIYITVEAPLSGMSMNPARSFASAAPAGLWRHLWVYFLAPVLGMQAAAAWHVFRHGPKSVACAKLLHPPEQRCIHCGFTPDPQARNPSAATGALQ
jgi:aquaporin Z